MWIRLLVDVERRDRHAERRPDAVVVDAGRHHEDQHLVARRSSVGTTSSCMDCSGGPCRSRRIDPGVHLRRHVAERRNLADLVEILFSAACMNRAGVSRHRLPRARQCAWPPYCWRTMNHGFIRDINPTLRRFRLLIDSPRRKSKRKDAIGCGQAGRDLGNVKLAVVAICARSGIRSVGSCFGGLHSFQQALRSITSLAVRCRYWTIHASLAPLGTVRTQLVAPTLRRLSILSTTVASPAVF